MWLKICTYIALFLSLFQIGGAQGQMHRMSFAEKQEEIPKDDWMQKLHDHHITRADMNCLIMNYLVTGKSNDHIIKSYTVIP